MQYLISHLVVFSPLFMLYLLYFLSCLFLFLLLLQSIYLIGYFHLLNL